MYKKSSKFFHGLNGAARKRRFGTGLTKSADVGRQDRHQGTHGGKPGWKDLMRRLDAEVAKANAAARRRASEGA